MVATELREELAYDGPDRRRRHARRGVVAQMSREELVKELLTDDLTGLGNRRAWEERVPQEGETVVMIDVDSLKWCNDELGHGVGDELLREVGFLLNNLATIHDGQSYRLAGDEFLLVLPPVPNPIVNHTRLARVCNGLSFFAHRVVGWEDGAGAAWNMSGVTLTYGCGTTLEEADTSLLENKSLRQAAGLRAPRGERPTRLVVKRAELDE